MIATITSLFVMLLGAVPAVDATVAEVIEFSHADWTEVLSRHVDDQGMVDYTALAQGDLALDRYIEMLSRISPASHPDLFPTRDHKLAFYINAKSFTDHRQTHEFYRTLNPHYTTLSQRRIFRFHARNYKVYTYVVNERIDMIKMLNMAVDGIITDYPDRLVQIREELKEIDRKRAMDAEG